MQEREKVTKLFEFLKEYNTIKNPLITEINNQMWNKWMGDLPEHKDIDYYIYSQDEEYLLAVRKPVLTQCPVPPTLIQEWLELGWEKPEKEVSYKDKIEKVNPNYGMTIEEPRYIKVKFEENKHLVKAFKQWEAERKVWANLEVITRQVDTLFNNFYALYATIKKEAEAIELVLGDGILLDTSTLQKIHHPILLQTVKLEFDANIPEFKLIVSEKGPELYKSLLSICKESNNELLLDIYKEFDAQEITPMNCLEASSFFNRVCYALSPNGKFLENYEDVQKLAQFPQIYRKPILFLRKRNLGFNIAIESILEDIKDNTKLPTFLKEIVGVNDQLHRTESTQEVVNRSKLNPNGIDKEILLTKPANTEQLLVAKYLQQNGAVLVQGPPGTGKTHTIANMIGHLLSEGKSILVTSYSEKALNVLKEKVTEDLQSLCLSLLSTTESRREMEVTLDNINEYRSSLEIATLNRKIDILERERGEQIESLETFKGQLKKIRMSEYAPIIIGGETYSPKDAAQYIRTYNKTANWLPGPIHLGIKLPLSMEQIQELYRTNITISIEDEQEYTCQLPSMHELMTPLEWHHLIEHKKSFDREKLNLYVGYWNTTGNTYETQDLKKLIKEIEGMVQDINLESEWILQTIEDGREGERKQTWIQLIKQVEEVYQLALEISEQRLSYNPSIEGIEPSIDVAEHLDKIIEKLEKGGKIGRLSLMLNPVMKKILDGCKINGDAPKKLNEFKVLRRYYQLAQARNGLKMRWRLQMVKLGAELSEDMGEELEIICRKYTMIIKENLKWYDEKWRSFIAKLGSMGLDIKMIDSYKDLSTDRYSRLKYIKNVYIPEIIQVIEAEIYRLEYDDLIHKQKLLENMVKKYSCNQNSQIMNILETALIQESIGLYKQAYEAIIELNELTEIIKRRKDLLDSLEKVASTWANAIRSREGIHGKGDVPLYVQEAWMYRQFVQEIDERNKLSVEKVQQEIIQAENSLRVNTSELAFNKAWIFKLIQFEKDRSQVQAIEGWRQLIRKIGAGKGKNAETLRTEVRKLMPKCQSAVPVWIMPLNKVVENFNPKQNKFDVVIIDEASQADVMALVALYLGKQIIIVGDHEQVSPLAIGEKVEDIERLAKQYLYDIPHQFLYSGKFSIYDLAQTAGYQPVRLKEHFRCVPDIIQYSNILSYNGSIKPLRDASKVLTKPAIVTYRVDGGIARNKVNKKEAEAIVAIILSCCKQTEYAHKTFGVITLRGDKQADIIDQMLQRELSPIEYGNRNILCGSPAQFQGDERDIIFLSMVDSNEGEGPMRLTSYGADNLYKKRYNVAVSRARDQLWVVYSMDADNDLKVGDIRKELLDYCRNYESREIEYKRNSLKAESEFEKRVMQYLINQGYKIIPQWEVGAYRIDMVAIYKDNKIAIECDGERWHGEEKLEEDMNRQAILERLGWRFIRIRGSQFFRDEIETMETVVNRLNELEIYPQNIEEIANEPTTSLKEAVIRAAEQILRENKDEIN